MRATGSTLGGGNFNGAGTRISAGLARWSLSGATPKLLINYGSGKSGSSFAVAGMGFPAGGTATLKVNGRVVASALTLDSAGGVTFRLSTSRATAGRSMVTLSGSSEATGSFAVDPTASLHLPDAAGQSYDVPAGIAFGSLTYLPFAKS